MRRLLIAILTSFVLCGLVAATRLASPPSSVLPREAIAVGVVQPRISPNGTRIAASYQGAIWTIPRIGGAMTRLTHEPGFDLEPTWSPDGKRLAYVNSPRFGGGDLRVITATGERVPLSQRIEVLGTIVYQKLDWLSDERLFGVFRVNGQSSGLGWVDLKTGETKSLLQAPMWARFAASPDGQSIVYTATPDQAGQQTGNDGFHADVWRIDANGGEPQKLFRFPSRIHDLCWDAQGSGLYVVTELGGGQAHNDLWYVPFSEPLARMRKITFGQADEDRPSISRDGRWLTFTDNHRGATTLIVRDLASDIDEIVKTEHLDFGTPDGNLKLTTIDKSKGEPVTARISVTQADGKLSAPPGSLYRTLNEVGHFYCDGAAEWTLPAGKYRVRAYRGLEYRPWLREIEVAADRSTELAVDLERWTDPTQRGWYSGENHIHANYGYGQWYSTPATMLDQCSGEGLRICNFVVANSETDGIFDREFFRGCPDSVSNDETILYWNQEFRSTIWGHMTLVNLSQLVEPIMTGFKESTNPWDVPTNGDIADRTHWQRGGLVNYTHAAQNPADPYENPYTGKGVPVDVALGKIDTLDLNATYAGTTVLWYRLLNCGFRLPASAGTDCFLNRISSRLPGADRVYVKLDGPLNYESWVEGLRAGRSFVSNGPMLEFSVGPHQIGDTLQLDRPQDVTCRFKSESHFPLAKVEVVYNGEVIVSAELFDDKRQAAAEQTIRLDRSGWLSLRASGPGHPDHPTASLEAHTSPIYVQVAGSPAGTRADAEYFLKWIDRLSLALRLRDRVPNDELRKHVQQQLEDARAVYIKIAETASSGG